MERSTQILDVSCAKKITNLVGQVLVLLKSMWKARVRQVKEVKGYFNQRSKDSSKVSNVEAITEPYLSLPCLLFLPVKERPKREAEIIWSLYCVRHGFSNRSMTHFGATLGRMFPNVKEINELALKRDAIKCDDNHGIYSYKDILKMKFSVTVYYCLFRYEVK